MGKENTFYYLKTKPKKTDPFSTPKSIKLIDK